VQKVPGPGGPPRRQLIRKPTLRWQDPRRDRPGYRRRQRVVEGKPPAFWAFRHRTRQLV